MVKFNQDKGRKRLSKMFKVYDYTTKKEKEYEFETKEKACEKFVEIATNYCEKYPKWAKETERDFDHYRDFGGDFTKFLEHECFNGGNFADIVICEEE